MRPKLNKKVFKMIKERYLDAEYVGGWYDEQRKRFIAISNDSVDPWYDEFTFDPLENEINWRDTSNRVPNFGYVL